MSARCRRQHCGAPLTERHDRHLGRVVFVCKPCERNKQGLCRNCPNPRSTVRSMFCRACSKKSRDAKRLARSRAAYADPKKRAKMNAAARRRYANNPEMRARSQAYDREYHRTHKTPMDDFARRYHREWNRHKYNTDPKFRARKCELARQSYYRRKARRASNEMGVAA